ncbi:glycosyltransferase family 32 protein [Liquorilactobacillus mali]|uniref:Mannosyltransferase OCH1 related enzyme n=1 Tax=Liquorilactobacillus mali TaxID=1618 RepID=A0A0R2FY81_9LACO|nr:glycosyltransferase [Liquorilactobacillus mali]KRN33104.1 mannosyltransferase OCH1 related enzyme [Liquorilactobacillus mali]
MIPKIINYCWFGGSELPLEVRNNIDNWKKICPSFQIKRWDESNYNVKKNSYIEKMYEDGNYAFLTDYVRLDIIYNYGGVYLDTDVKLIKSLDEIVSKGDFMAFEETGRVNTGIGFGAEPGNEIIKKNMDYYEQDDLNGQVKVEICVKVTTSLLISYGLDYEKNVQQRLSKIIVYPSDYFSPIKMGTSKINITDNTIGIHEFAASWYKGNKLIKMIKYRLIPLKKFIKVDILKKKLFE